MLGKYLLAGTVGFFCGGIFGVFVMCALFVAKHADEEAGIDEKDC